MIESVYAEYKRVVCGLATEAVHKRCLALAGRRSNNAAPLALEDVPNLGEEIGPERVEPCSSESSDLRRSEEQPALAEGIEAAQRPGAEEGSGGHLGGGALVGAGAAADLAAGDERADAAL